MFKSSPFLSRRIGDSHYIGACPRRRTWAANSAPMSSDAVWGRVPLPDRPRPV